MASNPRPTTRTSITYGPLGGVDTTSALMPVFIAPRYALHAHKEGYENAFLCKYDALNNATAIACSWPSLAGSIANVDVQSAKLIAENAIVAVNDTAITGVTVDESIKNKLIFPGAICDGNGFSRMENLGKYDVRVGDYIYSASAKNAFIITDIQAEDVPATATATMLGGTGALPAINTYNGNAKLIYLINVVELTDTGLVIQITGISGDAYTERLSCTFGTAVSIGNFNIEVTFSEGDYSTDYAIKLIAAPAGKGKFNTVYVNSENVSVGDITIATSNLADDTILLGDAAWSVTTAGEITLADTIKTTIAGKPSRIFEADMYVEYRELIADTAETLVHCNADGAESFVGLAVPENPLGFMYANARKINGAAFYVMSIAAATEAATIKALNVAAKFEAAYAPVTFIQTPAVNAEVDRLIAKYADPLIAQLKVTWRKASASIDHVVLPAEGYVLGTIHDGVVSFETGVDLVEAGVRVGDMLSVTEAYNTYSQSYSDFVCDIIGISADGKLTVAGAPNVGSWTKMMIKRVRTNREYATALAKEAKDLNNHRTRLVWTDVVNMYEFNNVDSVYVCAQLAALRSSLPPHAPLSDVAVPGVTIVDTLKFTDEEYDILNDGGVWVVANDSDGVAITQHQITTRTDGTIAEEESAVSNGDSMVREFRIGMKKYKGSSNIYEGLLPQIQADLEKIADNIIGRQYKAIYGPQLLSFSVKQLYIPESNNARVVCKCALETPKPLLSSDFEYNLF